MVKISDLMDHESRLKIQKSLTTICMRDISAFNVYICVLDL